ncbi:MAG: hypothetical protein WKF73_12550 [Nocardioidaceae bacterium]
MLAAELLTTELPDDPFMRGEVHRYFPSEMRTAYLDEMDSHPLRREIIVTQIVNDMVNSRWHHVLSPAQPRDECHRRGAGQGAPRLSEHLRRRPADRTDQCARQPGPG